MVRKVQIFLRDGGLDCHSSDSSRITQAPRFWNTAPGGMRKCNRCRRFLVCVAKGDAFRTDGQGAISLCGNITLQQHRSAATPLCNNIARGGAFGCLTQNSAPLFRGSGSTLNWESLVLLKNHQIQKSNQIVSKHQGFQAPEFPSTKVFNSGISTKSQDATAGNP